MSDASEIVGYVGGGTGVISGLVLLVKWLGGRVLTREEDDKKAIQARQERADERDRVTSDAIKDIKYDVSNVARGLVDMVKANEARAASQEKEIATLRSDFKEQIHQLETRIRSDMQRLVKEPRSRSRS